MFLKLFLICLGLSLATCRHAPFYRKDYTYFDEFDAFYKLHSDVDGVVWSSAFFSCEHEGSQLFYPKAPEEWKVVRNLFEAKGLSYENYTDIYVGIQNEGTEEFITVDGLATPSPLSNNNHINSENMCTTMDIENGSLTIDFCSVISNIESPTKPYVCKKVEDISCPTIDRGYTYVKETRKCYKVNKLSQNWHDALNTCVMEGGLLVNIESDMEARILSNLLETESNYHVGFRNIPPSQEYYTMKGQNVRDAYDKFYDSNNDYNHRCGAVMPNGNTVYLLKEECSKSQRFICEMNISM